MRRDRAGTEDSVYPSAEYNKILRGRERAKPKGIGGEVCERERNPGLDEEGGGGDAGLLDIGGDTAGGDCVTP